MEPTTETITCPHCSLAQAPATYCSSCLVHMTQYSGVQTHLAQLETQLGRVRDLFEQTPPPPPSGDETIRGLAEVSQGLRRSFQGITRLQREMATLVEVGKIINSVLTMDQLLNTIMDMAIKVMNAERGLLMLKDAQTGQLAMQAERKLETELAGGKSWDVSTNIISRVASEGKPILATDASQESAFQNMQSIIAHNIRSVLCVPLQAKTGEILGVIYLDNRMTSGAFANQSVEFLTAFAHQAAIAIENVRLYENVQKETTAKLNLQRYLAPSVAEDAIKRQGETILGGRRTECSMLFCDICSFTPTSQQLDPERVVRHLNEFFGIMTEIVFRHQGTMLEFLGDAVLALFGAPVPCADHARRAVAAALDMQREIEGLAERACQDGWPKFQIRIGINTGDVIAGNIGSLLRVKYAVVGDNVNLAARIQSHAKPGGILISETTYLQVGEQARVEPLPPLTVKGRTGTVNVFEVLDLLTQPADQDAKNLRRSERKEASMFAIFRDPAQSRVYQGTIKNISQGGMQLSTRDEFAAGAKLSLSFKLPNGDKVTDREARVIRSERLLDERGAVYFKMGVEFLEPTPE